MDLLDFIVAELRLGMFFDEVDDLLHHAIDMLCIRRNDGEAESGDLPDILVFYLGDGDVELAPHLRADGLHHAPLPFEGMVLR